LWRRKSSNGEKATDLFLETESTDHSSSMHSTPEPTYLSSSQSSSIVLPDLSNVDLTQMPLTMEQPSNKLSWGSELTNRCGIAYFSGLISSGIYGAFIGYKSSQKDLPFRLRMNSVLNHSMRLGANNGNMFAVLALYFVTFRHSIPKLSPIEMNDSTSTILSGALAGSLWKTFHPWQEIANLE